MTDLPGHRQPLAGLPLALQLGQSCLPHRQVVGVGRSMGVGFGQTRASHPATLIADGVPTGLPVDPADLGLLGAVVILDVDHLKPPGACS
jgi:hypothetical protein